MTDASISGKLPVKQAVISEVTIANNELVAAVPGKSIRVISLMFTVAAAVNIEFNSGTTQITGLMEFADSGGLTHENDNGIFWTIKGEALNLDQDAAIQISGVLTYVLTDGD